MALSLEFMLLQPALSEVTAGPSNMSQCVCVHINGIPVVLP